MQKIINLNLFHKNLFSWFEDHARILPWRQNPHWYKTFLSEFMLQQTQVNQALPYFNKFHYQYPDIYALANSEEHEVLTLWAGLGYYARARNLRKASIKIVNDFDGNFPETIKEALTLPGVGIYTAHAILSIAFNKSYAVVDGNVKRVISRLFTINEEISSAKTLQKISHISDSIINKENPSKYNEAIMELGATICTSVNPICQNCPVSTFCKANRENTVYKFPIKTIKKKKRAVFYYAFIIKHDEKYLIVKRKPKGLLASMWEFPSLEGTKKGYSKENLFKYIINELGIRGKIDQICTSMKYQYTHLAACYTPVKISSEHNKPMNDTFPDHKWIKLEEFSQYPIHTAHKKIARNLKIKSKG